jgi:hypothetical protein
MEHIVMAVEYNIMAAAIAAVIALAVKTLSNNVRELVESVNLNEKPSESTYLESNHSFSKHCIGFCRNK